MLHAEQQTLDYAGTASSELLLWRKGAVFSKLGGQYRFNDEIFGGDDRRANI